jgi:hypothetical protein
MNQRTCFNASLHRFALAAMLLAVPAAVPAQTPAAFPQLDVATTPGTQALASATLDGQGNVTLLWSQFLSDGGLDGRARWRRFGPADVPLGPDAILTTRSSRAREVVSNRRGDVLAIWNERLPSGATQGVLRRISPVVPTLNLRFSHPVDDVDVNPTSFFVTVWTVATPAGSRILGQRFDFDGRPLGPEFNATATASPGGELLGGVAMNRRGEFVVVWASRNADGSILGIFGRRFDFTGPRGSEFQVNTTEIGEAFLLISDVGSADDGSFVVAWSRRRTGEFSTDIFGQRFNNAGEKLGDEIVIAEDAPITDGYVRLAVAPEGHFAAAWDDGAPPLFVRLYRRDGTPAGPARELVKSTPFPGSPELDFGYNGTFVLAWNDFIGIHDPDDDNWEINYQRFAASPGTEVCVFRNGHFRCDTNGGGQPEIDHVFAVRGGVPLLGDVDDDGRDDYCLFRGTRFDCDSGHDYRAAETTVLFGQPGDTPLLGDVDGDGRDEACVFRTDRFLCDTGHDGGAAEATIVFGQAGDRAMLGDVNGDGRDDACVFRAGQFQCDTAGNGGAAETVIAFFLPGNGVPLLGDIDSDGRADPCFFGTGSFRCDTGHDGAVAETVIDFTGLGRPLIGNVDGL